MKLKNACRDILAQLSGVLSQIKDDDYSKPVITLNNATIGQHIRHTIEFFTCLMNEAETGKVNYDKRDHDKLIETDKSCAQYVIDSVITFIDNVQSNQPLVLEVNYDLSSPSEIKIDTNLERELAYNIEHAIHHMAIIKIGINVIAPYIKIPNHFGVAISTIKYRELEAS